MNKFLFVVETDNSLKKVRTYRFNVLVYGLGKSVEPTIYNIDNIDKSSYTLPGELILSHS